MSTPPASVLDALRREQVDLEALIRAAFAGVHRGGGVSWSEAIVIDRYGTKHERLAARSADPIRPWEDLIDDVNWRGPGGTGGFCFLDVIGFRYYLAPAMIRSLRAGHAGPLGGAFTLDTLAPKQEHLESFTEVQRSVIARFVRFMHALARERNDDFDEKKWLAAYNGTWRQFDASPRRFRPAHRPPGA